MCVAPCALQTQTPWKDTSKRLACAHSPGSTGPGIMGKLGATICPLLRTLCFVLSGELWSEQLKERKKENPHIKLKMLLHKYSSSQRIIHFQASCCFLNGRKVIQVAINTTHDWLRDKQESSNDECHIFGDIFTQPFPAPHCSSATAYKYI